MSKTIRRFEKGLAIAGWSGAVAVGLFGGTALVAETVNGVSSHAEYRDDAVSHPSNAHISESLQNSGFDAQATYVSPSISYDVRSFALTGLEVSAGVGVASFVIKKVIHENAVSAAQTVVGTRDFDPPRI